MIDFGVAYDKLASLDSADEIAGFLRSQEVKGNRGDASSCAISAWMQESTGDLTLWTSPDVIFRYDAEADDPMETMAYNTDAMEQFVKNFDCGNYPFLDAQYEEEE